MTVRVCAHKFTKLLTRGERRREGRREGRVDKRKRFKSAEVVKLNGQTSELMMLKVEYILGVSTGWRLIIDHREPETSSYLGSFFSTFQKIVKIQNQAKTNQAKTG